jgi:hypothetical protein
VQKLDDQKLIISTYNRANQTETGKIFLTDGNTTTEISKPDVQNNQLLLDFNPLLGVIWTGETTGDGVITSPQTIYSAMILLRVKQLS